MKRPPQIRSGLHAFWDILDRNKNLVPADVFAALDNTPFGKIIRLFAFGDLKPNDIYKDPTLLHRIVKLWDKKEQGFRFGDDLFYITPEDVSCIFGLPCSGITKDLTVRGRKDEHAEFFNKYFNPNVQTITKSMLEKALDATPVGRDKADMLVLLIMLLMCTFFFANAGSTISWSLLNLCVDVRGLKALSWPHMILDFMKSALNRGCADVAGCVPLIMYWLADKTLLSQRLPGRRSLSFSFCKWDMKDLSSKMGSMSDADIAVLLKGAVKEETMMGAFVEGQKSNIFYMEPESEVQPLAEPSFDIWKFICKDELKRREEEAQKNLIEIISSLEEQVPDSSAHSDRGIELLITKLHKESKRIIEQNKTWWTMMEQIQVERNECEEKVLRLKADYLRKQSLCDEKEIEIQNLQRLLGKQNAENDTLRTKIVELEKNLNDRNSVDVEVSNSLPEGDSSDPQDNLIVDDSPDEQNDNYDMDISLSQISSLLKKRKASQDEDNKEAECSRANTASKLCKQKTKVSTNSDNTGDPMSDVMNVVEELTLADLVEKNHSNPKTPSPLPSNANVDDTSAYKAPSSSNANLNEIAANLMHTYPFAYQQVEPTIKALQIISGMNDFAKDTLAKKKSPPTMVKKVKAKG